MMQATQTNVGGSKVPERLIVAVSTRALSSLEEGPRV
jgi:hypothetical protein